MCSKIEQINVNNMFNRAMSIRENTVITYTNLMTDKEIKIWNSLNSAERVGIILSFNLMLVKNDVDRRIVPSIKLDDERIFINNN
ncbi:hypothetical protein HMPREF3265_04940 [Staphylococcus sp. HMSC62B09]|uniref:Uncharacterized protein n=1 Tax=Staphylococcus haemolyticus TaxID=1283 RepID=A0A2K0AWF3_STAHA|nr:hypothetical protein HMPREF2722_10875 [Staphylococcus sp. HMSC074A11]OFM37908.1 hypothetical protein HMPREF2695_08040 [Staphylococcus sp. HMSC076E07]OFM39698.1 hypothetical protein HMPREF2694_10370 [Staphylococcus sp. HMSC076B11]OFP90011.1 hypothetical protein HMPREF2966_03865 [Staphylococcus sp. HMSC072D04]OHQ38199.1 hypothetical protein HMPREF2588_09795 [Staphylococcus sp. HMSC069D04]OHR10042.1 hypothetical protein HMPREF2587_05200 [Staphylococcus sp. HMSC078A08]OHS41649.1 hypothetical p